MKNLKEVMNYELENMQVTENLKIETLEKCRKSGRKLYLRNMTVKIASVLLVVSMGYYYGFYNETPKNYAKVNPINNNLSKDIEINKDNKHENSEKIINEENNPKISINNEKQSYSKPDLSSSKITVKSSNEEKINSAKDLEKQEVAITTLPNGETDNASNVMDTRGIAPCGKNVSYKSNFMDLTLEEAEKSLNMKIMLPSYIPKGYKILNIRGTVDKSDTIIINYSSDSSYFYIKENKDQTLDKNNKTEKSITEDNSEISITWTENQVIYSVGGNLSKDIIESIANSIK